MYELMNTFTSTRISGHRKLACAVRAEFRYQRAFARRNPAGSYLRTEIRRTDGKPLTAEERSEIRAVQDRLERFARPVRSH